MRQIDRFILYVVHNWKSEINEAYSEKTIQGFINKFKDEADDLNINITDDQLRTYIERFDILKNSPKVTEKDLNQVSLGQLIKLVTSSRGVEAPEEIDITPDVVYHNDDNTIVVYNGSKEGNCINYGNGEKWCITKGSFGNYRYDSNRGYPTFYLARNTNLNDDDPLSFVAIQVRNKVANVDRYVFTNRKNQPYESKPMSFEELLDDVPWLKEIPNLKSTLKYIPLSSTELATQQFSRNPVTVREWTQLPFSTKEQYLVVRKGKTLFEDITNDEFVRKYLPNYPQLATFVARNADIIEPVTLLKNLEAFTPNDRKSVTENLRDPIDIRYLTTDTIPFDVKKLLVRLNKWEIPADQRLYVTKDGRAIVRLTTGGDFKLSLYTEEADYPNVKINQRTSKYITDYPDLDKIPVNNLLKLIEDGIIDQSLLNKIIEKAQDDPNSAIIIGDTEDGKILLDSNSFSAYKIKGNNVTQVPFDDEDVQNVLNQETENTGFQDNALGLFKGPNNIPDNISQASLTSLINSIPFNKRIITPYGRSIPSILLPSGEERSSFYFMPANPNIGGGIDLLQPIYSWGRDEDWRHNVEGRRYVLNQNRFEQYFAYLRNENLTLSDETILKTFKGQPYGGSSEAEAKVAFVEANPPTSTENQYAPVMYDGVAYLINKTDPRNSLKVSSNTGKTIKANISPVAARRLTGGAATPELAAAQGAGDREEAPLRRRGRPAGGGAPRPQGQAGDVNIAGALEASGLNGAFQLLPRNDYRRLNVTNARAVPVANDRGASRRNNILGDAGRVTNAFVTPEGSTVYIIRLANNNIIASIVVQPGNRHYILIDNNGFRSAVPLNSPRELRQALQQRGLAENIKNMAAKFYLAENPSMLGETVNMLKKLKEITVKPKTLQQYEAVKFENNPYVNLNISFLENYIDEFLEEPYEYEKDLEYFVLDVLNNEPIDTNTITLPNFINYLTDNNFERWFGNDFKEIKYILSLKDISSIDEYVNKKAKELSKNNPEDFEFYQDEIKDVVLKLKEQLPLFLKTIELLNGKYTVLSSFLDYFNSLYSIFVFSDGKDLRYIAVDKDLGYFDNKGNLQIKKEIYDNIYREEDYELDEIKIVPQSNIDLTRAKYVTRRYIGQNSDLFQNNYIYDLIDLGSYYTIRPHGGDESNFYLLFNKKLFDDNLDVNSDNKLDTIYPPKELTQPDIEDLQKSIKNKQPEYVNELKVIPVPLGRWSNIPAPALYNFVRANYKALLEAIKKDVDKNNPNNDEDYTFEAQTGITDINNVNIDPQNYWEYIDEDGEYPDGQEIAITAPNPAHECEGIYISNMDNDAHDKFGSGMSFDPIPGVPGLYYEIMWC